MAIIGEQWIKSAEGSDQINKNDAKSKYKTPSFTKKKSLIFKALYEQRLEARSNGSK